MQLFKTARPQLNHIGKLHKPCPNKRAEMRVFTEFHDLPKLPCVYEAWLDGRCVYVGQTANLRGRFREHKFQFSSIIAHRSNDRHERRTLERMMIKSLNPVLNVHRPLSRIKNKTIGSMVDKKSIIGPFCEWVS